MISKFRGRSSNVGGGFLKAVETQDLEKSTRPSGFSFSCSTTGPGEADDLIKESQPPLTDTQLGPRISRTCSKSQSVLLVDSGLNTDLLVPNPVAFPLP